MSTVRLTVPEVTAGPVVTDLTVNEKRAMNRTCNARTSQEGTKSRQGNNKPIPQHDDGNESWT